LSSRQADIYRAALTARVRANVPAAAGDPQVVGFLTEIIIMAVISWLIQRCLSRIWPTDFKNPSRLALWRLDRAIRRGCAEAAVRHEAGELDADEIYALLGPRVREAFLRTGREMQDHDIESFRAAMAQP
jgi:hypothetical protein